MIFEFPGREMLTKALDAFSKNSAKISEELKAGLKNMGLKIFLLWK